MYNPDLSLYLVTDRSLALGRSLAEIVEEAVKGGVTVVQLREKNCSSAEFYRLAVELRKLLDHYHVSLIINDRLDIALACDADGLHIGQNDIPYSVARKLLGKHKIIGLSVESVEDALKANALDVNYIGISPVFDTPTKTDTAAALGLEGTKKIAELSIHPCVGIGGINLSNAADVMQTGVNGLCIVSAIMSANDPQTAAAQLKQIIESKQK